MKSDFNLSAAALKYRQLTFFFLAVIAAGGIAAFFQLGQREDPDFAFRAMVIRTVWPGATAEQVDRQVTDRIERKLQETPYYKWTRSYSRPGESFIILELEDVAAPKDVPAIWYQVRKKVDDIRHTLPLGVLVFQPDGKLLFNHRQNWRASLCWGDCALT